MNKEFGASGQENAEWQEPTSEALAKENKDNLGVMGKIAEFSQKLPGGKYLLPAATMLSMLGGSVKETEADAKDYLRYENGITMTTPIILASELGGAGITKKPDGSYVIEDKEIAETLIGDLIYQSGQDLTLPENPEKVIKDDLADYKKELNVVCQDRKLITDLEAEINGFAQATFPDGYNKQGRVMVERLNSKSGQVEKKLIGVQWAKFREVELEVSKHMAKIQSRIFSLKDSSRAKVTDMVLREHGDLIKKAALFNLARSEKLEQIGQK